MTSGQSLYQRKHAAQGEAFEALAVFGGGGGGFEVLAEALLAAEEPAGVGNVFKNADT